MDSYSKTRNVSFTGFGFGTVRSYSGTTEQNSSRSWSSSIPSVVETFNGEKNPTWRQTIRMHGNATTFASGTKLRFSASKYSCTVNRRQVSQNYTLYGVVSEQSGLEGRESGYPPFLISQGHYPASSDLINSVANTCIRKFIAKFQDARSAFEAGQDLGELRETLSMFSHRGSQIHAGMNNFLTTLLTRAKKRSPYKAPKQIKKRSLRQIGVDKMIADTYLEYRFGWNPLIKDIQDGLAAIGRFSEPVVRIQAHSSGRESAIQDSNYFGAITGNTIAQPVNSYRQYERRMIGGVRVRKPGQVESLAQKYQLLPQDWLPTLWDLLPYSWLVDYFTNIGDIIRGASFVTGDLAWGCRTDRTSTVTVGGECRIHRPFPIVLPDNWYFISNEEGASGGEYIHEMTTFSRAPLLPGDFVPSFEFHIPTSTRPWVNMAALLVSRGTLVSKTLGRIYDLVNN